MIRYKSSRQINLDGFTLLFGGKLSPENRLVKWSKVSPWKELAGHIIRQWMQSKDVKKKILGW